MDYDYIEKLVSDCKNGDKNSKEKLIEEFKPYIINISKRTFIYGYEFEDLMNGAAPSSWDVFHYTIWKATDLWLMLQME